MRSFDQEAIRTGLDDLRDTSGIAGDDRQTDRHRFEHRVRHAFPQRRHQKHVAKAKVASHVPRLFEVTGNQNSGAIFGMLRGESREVLLLAGTNLADHEEARRLEGGDVDITKADILISVGRGIGDGDDIEMVDELAEALGGAVSASRPVVDAGWLPKSRQVGKSGQTVKPKLYLAVGISGAPEHLEGMRDADLIVAINQDAAAPIFSIADYGVVGDLFDVIPELTERVKERAEA